MTKEELVSEQVRFDSAFRDVVFPSGLKLYSPDGNPLTVFLTYDECTGLPDGLIAWIMFEIPDPGSPRKSESWSYGFNPLEEDIESAIGKASVIRAARARGWV